MIALPRGSRRLHRRDDLGAGNMEQIIKKWQTVLPSRLGTVLSSHKAEELVRSQGLRGSCQPTFSQHADGGRELALSRAPPAPLCLDPALVQSSSLLQPRPRTALPFSLQHYRPT